MEVLETIHTQDYRETLSTSASDGRRIWIYPKIEVGKLYRWRALVAYLLIAGFTIAPLLEKDGHPLFLLNVLERKFILFGMPFLPQDFNILALVLITFMVFIVLFTVIFGRIWCGWACPQTVFMEMVFRRIENWIEGDFKNQQKFDESPLSLNKIARKTFKHFLFLLVSFCIANLFFAYIVGKNELWALMLDGPLAHWQTLAGLLIFTAVFYFVFARFRELVCVFVCPYGRLQGVLLDKKSIVVAYDFVRGEPRGRYKKETQENNKQGDCINCKACVNVCPTGIDIRNGTQLECVNCTSCIDACDSVMLKLNKSKGLIRYASLDGIETKKPLKFSTRIAAYSTLLLILVGVLIFLFTTRGDLEATIIRTPGLLYNRLPNNYIANLYNLEMVNKTFEDIPFELKANNPKVKIKWVGQNQDMVLRKEKISKGSFFVEIPESELKKYKTDVILEVWSEGILKEKLKTAFISPN
jgi:cytochrome c oxidase accessory protein FixG